MAFETNLVAINWCEGKYHVESQINGHIATDRLRNEHRLRDASDSSSGYVDLACVLSREEFPAYLLDQTFTWAKETKRWFEALPQSVKFILVHAAEWESGLGD